MTHVRRDNRPMCNAQLGLAFPAHDNPYKPQPAYCHNVVGLRVHVAPDGTRLSYCGALGHRARVERQAARLHGVVA